MLALVTGSAGFIGRHITAELKARGYWVYGIDVASTDSMDRADALDYFRYQYHTVYDLVVHCAFHVGGRAAIDGLNTNFMKNLELDAAMFEFALRTKQKHVLYFSSSAAYPQELQSKIWVDYHDQTRLEESDINLDWVEQPDATYGWAKLTGERLAEDARKNGLQVTVVRPFSGYGEDQSLDYPFPSIVARAKQGDLSVWGPQGQTRDWIHVSDVVNGALAVYQSGTTDPVNLCTGRGVEMGKLAQMVHLYHDGCTHMLKYDETKPTGVFHRVGDPARFNQYYTPKVSLEEGIARALKVL